MSWWDFEEGREYDLDEVVSKIRSHIKDSGQVKNIKEKLQLLEQIERCGHSRVTYAPEKTRWGASPMNPESWRTNKGKPIV